MNRESVIRQLQTVGRDFTVNSLLASNLCPGLLRTKLLRSLGFRGIHPTARIFPHTFLGSRRLTMAEGSAISYGCFLDLGAQVTIGRGTGISYQTMLITTSHEIGTADRRYGTDQAKPITIGDGVWIGARVTVMPGVTIGSGSVVAAGSTVTRDLAPNGVYAGSPARRVRDLE